MSNKKGRPAGGRNVPALDETRDMLRAVSQRAYLSGMPNREIAERAGLSLSTAYKALNNGMPSLDTFIRLANAVGCQVNLVCYGKDKE